MSVEQELRAKLNRAAKKTAEALMSNMTIQSGLKMKMWQYGVSDVFTSDFVDAVARHLFDMRYPGHLAAVDNLLATELALTPQEVIDAIATIRETRGKR